MLRKKFDAAANLGSLSVLIINLTYAAAVGVSAIEILSHRILDLTRSQLILSQIGVSASKHPPDGTADSMSYDH